ncbi:winged helix-turn-helix transcriptional regulator [Candidatus Nomurabacteria bacterium]|nr:winged helix-turn-helix transcriptional regulator [Candidatus Nomurabacteria bacterium]
MNKKSLGIRGGKTKPLHGKEEKTYPRPSWVKSGEEELCPGCFKVVGDRSRYNLVCMLGKAKEGMTVGELTEQVKLKQPTVTHHLQVLKSVDAVHSEDRGRERVYKLNRDAHCFEDCKIPY